MLRTIKLEGEAASKFGQSFNFHVETPEEALRALFSQVPGTKQFLTRNPHYMLRQGIEIDKKYVTLSLGKCKEVVICPIPRGESQKGKYIGKTIAGTLIAFAGIITAQPWIIGIGLAFAFSGIAGLLLPVPEVAEAGDADPQPTSHLFRGGLNRQKQGVPVPLVYGRMRTGSVVAGVAVRIQDTSAEIEQESRFT